MKEVSELSFVFYESFMTDLEDVSPEERTAYITAIINYGLYDIEPEFKGFMKKAFHQAAESIDRAKNRRETNINNGKNGGKPTKTEVKANETESKPNDNPTITESKPTDNRNITETNPTETESKPTDNLNVNVNVNDNVNVNSNGNADAPASGTTTSLTLSNIKSRLKDLGFAYNDTTTNKIHMKLVEYGVTTDFLDFVYSQCNSKQWGGVMYDKKPKSEQDTIFLSAVTIYAQQWRYNFDNWLNERKKTETERESKEKRKALFDQLGDNCPHCGASLQKAENMRKCGVCNKIWEFNSRTGWQEDDAATVKIDIPQMASLASGGITKPIPEDLF